MSSQQQNSPAASDKSVGASLLCFVVLPAVIVFTCLAAVWGLETHQGKRAWDRYCETVKARGDSLTPPAPLRRSSPIGPNSNSLLDRELDEADKITTEAERLPGFRASSDSTKRQFEDLVAWGRALERVRAGKSAGGSKGEEGNTNVADRAQAAEMVLQAMTRYDPIIDKLLSSCRRPDPDYPFGYNSTPPFGPVPQVFAAINVCRRLRTKTSAELVVGRNARALQEFELMFCLSESLGRESSLISAIGSIACRAIALRTPWEGLAERRFTESELRQLLELPGTGDMIEISSRSIIGERNLWIAWMEQLPQGRATVPLRSTVQFCGFSFSPIFPPGSLQFEKLNYAQWMDTMAAGAFANSPKRIRPGALDQAWRKVSAQLTPRGNLKAWLNHTYISSMLMPKIDESVVLATAMQVATDQLSLACALELYFLRHGRYPETLGPVVPEFLPKMPTDPLTGEPYRYAREPNGRYKLWSVGWNEKDDDGAPGEELFSKTSGDWVWQYPR